MTGARSVSQRLVLLGSASAIALLRLAPAQAQTVELPQPPINSMVDERGVDLVSGQLMVDFSPLSIGDASNGLSQALYYPGKNGFRHDQMITATADDYNLYGQASGYHVTVALGKIAHGFTWTAGVYVSDKGDGATLSMNSALTKWTYTDKTGVVIELDRTFGTSYTSVYNTTNYYGGADGVATTVTRPDGFKIRFNYKRDSYNYSGYGTVYVTRLQSTTTSTGYQLKFIYQSDTLSQATANDWVGIAQEKMINNAVEYCDPTADACSGLTQAWPTMTVARSTSGSNGILSFTDPGGRTSSFTFDSSGRIIGHRRPNASADTTTYGYSTGTTAISSVAVAGVGTWNYTFALNQSNVLTGTVTTPTISNPLTVTSNYLIRQPLTVTDENGRQTTSTYDTKGRILTHTLHGTGANYTTYAYDSRGNLTSMVLTPKSGSGLGTLSSAATYLASPCTNAATCNKPITTTNSDGKVTNYYYNSNGTLDYVQAPVPTSGAARPETHYTYTTAQARVKNASGTIVDQGDPVAMPTGTVTCVSGSYSSCTSANQIVTELGYGIGTGATNLAVKTATVKSGSGSPSTTTTLTYNNLGDAATVTDPVGNVTTTTYAADRQPTLVVSPSIDGSSTSNRRAVAYHYNTDGLLDIVTQGSYNPSTEVLTPMVVGTASFDTQGRKLSESVSNGSNTYALTQYSYNGAGRLDCSAVRMNPAVYGSVSGACTLGTEGSAGPDRITRFSYDNVGQVLKTQSAYGVTGKQRDDVTFTYTDHNQRQTMVDPNGNLTSFVYDGHDRLARTCYQGTLTVCQANSSSDYVQLGYNSAGRLISRSLRGTPSSTIGYTYDDLGRITDVTYPGGGTFDKPVTFAYDNLGRMLSATDTSGHSVTHSYDALGNVLTQGDAISSRTMLYDAAGRRTRLTWSDNRYVTYEYNGASDLTAIKESGSVSLATFAYDGIGRRTSLTRGNGVVTNYSGHTPLGVGAMGIDLAGTGNDQTLGFTYNPAGQIATRTSANDAWAFTGRYTVNRNYTANSLNQYTASGAIVPTHDAKGNLTSAGSPAYVYSTKNELVQRTDTGATFYHDPLGQLDTVTSSSGTTKFQYLGTNISVELDASNAIKRRYVFGPGVDEPLVWYEGSDFSNKSYLVADERGSVIAVTDDAGHPATPNAYDEYGIPAWTNRGRFQYTGQAWIPELGMYSYKARIYSPTLGRFLQTDPIGYPDGPNWYAYVNNDPINKRDPSGLEQDIVVRAHSGGGGYFGGGYFGGGSSGAAAAAHMQMMAMMNALQQQVSILIAQIEGGRLQNESTALTPNEIDEIVVSAARAGSLGGVKINFDLKYPQEQLWVLYARDVVAYLGINGAARGNTGENRGTPPRPGYQAIIHTHPSWAEYGPGPKDSGFPVPLYGIAPNGVWVVRPGATSPTRLYGARP